MCTYSNTGLQTALIGPSHGNSRYKFLVNEETKSDQIGSFVCSIVIRMHVMMDTSSL